MVCDKECQEDIMDIANGVAGGLTLATMVIALAQIANHLVHYTNSYFQNKIIMIIFMAPFYALTSFFTIVFKDATGYFALIRDIYEAILIYCFFNLLALYVAYEPMTKDVDYDRIYEILATKGIKEHLWPMKYFLRPIALISKIRAQWFFRKARLCILQFLAIRPAAAFLLVIVYLVNEDSTLVKILKVMVFISVCLSVYYLVLFYQLLHEELAPHRPLLKFISVKGVLFFTFWQDFVIEMFKSEILGQFSGLSLEQEKFAIEVCQPSKEYVSLLGNAIITAIAFSHKDFKHSERHRFNSSTGVGALTKKLMNNVLTDTFVTVIEDLKELKEPLKDPFKSYRDANVQQTELMTISCKKKKGLIAEEDLNQFRVNVIEKARIIPNFIENKKSTQSDEKKSIS